MFIGLTGTVYTTSKDTGNVTTSPYRPYTLPPVSGTVSYYRQSNVTPYLLASVTYLKKLCIVVVTTKGNVSRNRQKCSTF